MDRVSSLKSKSGRKRKNTPSYKPRYKISRKEALLFDLFGPEPIKDSVLPARPPTPTPREEFSDDDDFIDICRSPSPIDAVIPKEALVAPPVKETLVAPPVKETKPENKENSDRANLLQEWRLYKISLKPPILSRPPDNFLAANDPRLHRPICSSLCKKPEQKDQATQTNPGSFTKVDSLPPGTIKKSKKKKKKKKTNQKPSIVNREI